MHIRCRSQITDVCVFQDDMLEDAPLSMYSYWKPRCSSDIFRAPNILWSTQTQTQLNVLHRGTNTPVVSVTGLNVASYSTLVVQFTVAISSCSLGCFLALYVGFGRVVCCGDIWELYVFICFSDSRVVSGSASAVCVCVTWSNSRINLLLCVFWSTSCYLLKE